MTTVVSVRGKKASSLLKLPNFRYVGRAVGDWEASKWANPFRVAKQQYRVVRSSDVPTIELALEKYNAWIDHMMAILPRKYDLRDLQGMILGCWCCDWDGKGPVPKCHAALLADRVNRLTYPDGYHTHFLEAP